MEPSYLENQWNEMVDSYGGHPDTADAWFGNILDAYSQPHRRYHTIKHIDTLIRDIHILAMKERINDPRVIEWAAYFHDYVYDPGNPRNEELSAEVAEKALFQMGFASLTADKVTDLIMRTKTHEAEHIYSMILCDADTLVLCAPEKEYIQYCRGIRQEFSFVPINDFKEGRTEFIRSVLKRKNIFYTETCKRFEHHARENLANELTALKGPVML